MKIVICIHIFVMFYKLFKKLIKLYILIKAMLFKRPLTFYCSPQNVEIVIFLYF